MQGPVSSNRKIILGLHTAIRYSCLGQAELRCLSWELETRRVATISALQRFVDSVYGPCCNALMVVNNPATGGV